MLDDEPVKYWLSNLPTETPIVTLVGLAKLRWRRVARARGPPIAIEGDLM